MTEKLFDPQALANLAARRTADAPVRAELTRRLLERLDEVKGGRERVLHVTAEMPDVEAGGHDAVVYDMVLPTAEDVPVSLWHGLQALRPDGLLLATALGLESFREFRAAWAEVGEPQGHVIPLTDVRDAGALLQKFKLALPVVDRDVLTVTFADFAGLYKALRAHGVGNVSTRRAKGLTGKAKMRAMEEAYVRLFGREDGRIALTLEIIYLHGFVPADNQPQPAKRGSGKVSLVRILDGAADNS